MSELLPCPFCGKDPVSSRTGSAEPWVVYCPHHIEPAGPISYVGVEAATQELAEAAWNKREMGTQKVLVELFKERVKQILHDHYDFEHDAKHSPGCLARAGAAYALLDVKAPAITYHSDGMKASFQMELKLLSSFLWPWDDDSFKPKDPRRNLVRAAALIIAEIERMDRAAELKAAALGDVDA